MALCFNYSNLIYKFQGLSVPANTCQASKDFATNQLPEKKRAGKFKMAINLYETDNTPRI